jgi:hypothetical protein
VFPRSIEHHDARLHRQVGERSHQVRNTHGLDRHVRRPGDVGIDRNDVVFALGLEAVASEIDHSDRVRAGLRRLVHEITECVAQRFAVEVTSARDIETGGLQLLGDQAGVVGRRR